MTGALRRDQTVIDPVMREKKGAPPIFTAFGHYCSASGPCSKASRSLFGHEGHDLVVAACRLGELDLLVARTQRNAQNSQ